MKSLPVTVPTTGDASHHSGKSHHSWKICLCPHRARMGHSSQRLPGLEDVCVLEQRQIHTFLTNHQQIQLSVWCCSARLSYTSTFPCLKSLLWGSKVHLLSLKRITISERSAVTLQQWWQMTGRCVWCKDCPVLAVQSFVLPHALKGAPWWVRMGVALSLPAGEQLLSPGTQREGDTIPCPPTKKCPSKGVRRQPRNLLGP